MSLFRIAWRSIQQRGLASALTTLSMMLGVVLVVMVLSIHGVVAESFRNNASLGYNMIVGAKGGKLQLTLNTVYYLSEPVENIPYEYYLEFKRAGERRKEYEQSFGSRGRELEGATGQLESISAAGGLGPGAALAQSLAAAALEKTETRRVDLERDGKFSAYTEMAIPLCLGDYYHQFRLVGTVPEFFKELKLGPEGDRPFRFAQGRSFVHYSKEHGYFEAVVGANAARELGIRTGHQFSPQHGNPEGHEHERKFTVVGVLEPTGTPNDRAVFVNIEGFYLMEDHAKPIESEKKEPRPEDYENGPPLGEGAAHGEEEHEHEEHLDPLPIEQREVTAILLKTDFRGGPWVENLINEGPAAQAVLPVREIVSLFSFIVEPIEMVLLALTAMICVVSGISILVSIYNSMSDRRHEIAVMRALGAGRGTVMTIILLESVLLSLMGGGIGWVAAHLLNGVASPFIEDKTGVIIGVFSFVPSELLIVPALLVLAMAVGFLPALSAYRTDVARSLGK